MLEPKKFRKKPVEIEAMQWTGENGAALHAWMKGDFQQTESHGQFTGKDYTAMIWVAANDNWSRIETGEWVLCDSKGFYPCKPDIFEATYEEVLPADPLAPIREVGLSMAEAGRQISERANLLGRPAQPDGEPR